MVRIKHHEKVRGVSIPGGGGVVKFDADGIADVSPEVAALLVSSHRCITHLEPPALPVATFEQDVAAAANPPALPPQDPVAAGSEYQKRRRAQTGS